jgi:hypothetical protein
VGHSLPFFNFLFSIAFCFAKSHKTNTKNIKKNDFANISICLVVQENNSSERRERFSQTKEREKNTI